MRKSIIASMLAGFLMLAGLVNAKGPRTTLTVTLSGTANSAQGALVVCADATQCSDEAPMTLGCPFEVNTGESTTKFICDTGFKPEAVFGSIALTDPFTGNACVIDATAPVLLDQQNILVCQTETGVLTVKIGTGPDRF